MATKTEVKSIDAFLIERGYDPAQVVNGASLKDLLWAFWVEEDDYRRSKTKELIVSEIASSTGPTGGWLDSPKAICAEIVKQL